MGKTIKDPWVSALLAEADWPAPPAHLKSRIMARLDARAHDAAQIIPADIPDTRAIAAVTMAVMAIGFAAGLLTSEASAQSEGYSIPYATASSLFMQVFKA